MDIESLQIEIVSESDKATKNLDKFTKYLEKLDAMGNRTGFDKLYQKLQKLSSLDFSNLTGLGATSGEKTSSGKGTAQPKVVGSKTFSEAKATQAEMAKRFKVDVTTSETPLMGTQTAQMMERTGASQSETSRSAKHFSDAMSEAKQSVSETVATVEKLKSSTDKTSESAAKVEKNTEKANKSMEKMGKHGSRTMMQSAKTILLYSVLFSAMTTITQGITEGLQNVARYSEEANEALTKYKTLNLEIKNAVGAAAVPMIRTFYPVISLIADATIDAANGLNMLFSAFKHEKTFVKAKKYVDDYAKSLNNLKGTTGLDQINTLSKGYEYSEMFEEVEIDSGEVWDAVGGVAALTGGVLLLKGAMSGLKTVRISGFRDAAKDGYALIKATGGTTLQSLAGGLKNVYYNMTPVTKGLLGAGGLVAGFALAQSGGEKLAKALSSDTKEGLFGAFASLAGGVGAGAAGGAMIGGPIEAVIGACGVLVLALGEVARAQTDLAYEMAKTEYYDIQGTKITEIKDALNRYFESMDFDKQADWIQMMNDAQLAYDDAKSSYDLMWESIASKTVFDASDIEGLTQAFNDLANAANAVNEANIGSLMASIKTGIELNITDALSDKLGGLLNKVREAQSVLEVKITNISAEYQAVLNEIVANGGIANAEQKEKMRSLQNDLVKFTLSDNTASERWNIEIEEAQKNAINAGTDKDSVLANVEDLLADRDVYLKNLKDKYAKDMNTLTQLIEKDKNELGGQLGFSNADIETLKTSYNSQIKAVNTRYNDVLKQIIATYEDNVLDPDEYLYNEDEWLAAGFDVAWSNISALWGDDRYANMLLAYEQQELLTELKDYLLPGYATGGFPEDGLFMANSGELVGKFTNGRTAVANNAQIIEGIKQGVKEANLETVGQGGDWIIQIVTPDGTVQSEAIITAADRRNRRDGRTVIPLGV